MIPLDERHGISALIDSLRKPPTRPRDLPPAGHTFIVLSLRRIVLVEQWSLS